MRQVRSRPIASTAAVAVLLAGLAGCGGETPAPAPPPAPPPVAPPAFQPQPIEVELGESGSKVTLMTAESGGFTLDGEAFESGEEVTADGNKYVLELADGLWTARYKAPEFVVTLGITEETATIVRAEDGTYRLDDDLVKSGKTTVTASNGNLYRLTLSADGDWTAVFQAPDPVTVPLGSSGSAVEVETLEDGTYRIGGEALADGDTVRAANRNRYRLALSPEGQWSASFRPTRVRVALGEHGGRVALFRQEAGEYTLDGSPFESGTVVEGDNGGEYELILGPDGTWTAAYQALVQTVPLGTSGDLVLTKLEDGTWTNFKRDFEDGKTLRADNDSRYVLRFRNGFWSAEFVPDEVPIEGTDLVATWLEDRSGYRIGTSALLPRNGNADVSVDGALYHVWKHRQVLYATRFDEAPLGYTARRGSYQAGTGDLIVELIEDDEDTIANESGTAVKVGGGEFGIEELLETGAASFDGTNIVARAAEDITLLLKDWQILLEALDDDEAALRELTTDYQAKAQEIVDRIFGPAEAVLKDTTDPDKLLGQLNTLIEALSSEQAFTQATREDGGGILEGAMLSEARAKEVFGASDLRSRVIFRASGDTRYGAIRTEGRDRGRAVNDLALDSDSAAVGTFAYSTTAVTARSRHVRTHGSASYKGQTTTVSGDGTLYVGDIELEVHFGDKSVRGLVTNLEDENEEPWAYFYQAVEAIYLRDSTLLADASWTRQVRDGDGAAILFRDTFARPSLVQSSFQGRLLGIDGDAGSQALGTWSIGDSDGGSNYLAGSFGSQRVEGAGGRVPPGEEQTDRTGTVSRTVVVPAATEIEDGVLTLRGTLFGPNLETTETEEQWDDEVQLLEDGRRIEDTYQLDLADLFLRQASVKGYLGRNLIDLAREEVARLREQLVVAIGLGEESGPALELRRTTWDEINDSIRARLFGTADEALGGTDYRNDPTVPNGDPRKWSSGYPVSSRGRPDDKDALDAVDAVLAALESPGALAAAIKEGGRGVFTRDEGAPFRPAGSEDMDAIWNRAEARLEVWLRSTDYTRFGAWRKQTAPNAWSDYKDRSESAENGPGAFAYSHLPQATYADNRFPHGGSATYEGTTIAVQQTEFYEGRIEMVASWHLDMQGQDEAGTLAAVISNLEDQNARLLSYTDSVSGEEREREIEELVLAGIGIRVDSESRLYFAEDVLGTLRISFANRDEDVDLGSDPSVTSSIEGKFLGRSSDGPQGVIGTWSLRDAGDTRVGVGDRIHGAFGAEFRP